MSSLSCEAIDKRMVLDIAKRNLELPKTLADIFLWFAAVNGGIGILGLGIARKSIRKANEV